MDEVKGQFQKTYFSLSEQQNNFQKFLINFRAIPSPWLKSFVGSSVHLGPTTVWSRSRSDLTWSTSFGILLKIRMSPRDTWHIPRNRVLRIINRNRWWCNSDSVPGTFPKVDCVYFLIPGVHFYHRLNVHANKCTLIMITCSLISLSFYISHFCRSFLVKLPEK